MNWIHPLVDPVQSPLPPRNEAVRAPAPSEDLHHPARSMPAARATHLLDEGLAGGIEAHHRHLRPMRGQLFLCALQCGHGGQVPQSNAAPNCPADAKNTCPRTR
ncbi:hypothetical protein G6F61_014982 [Rhizopus arrhizus]|nr:hypothetical protein G6F61_014982 [Rhizopus arrhizus]